MTKYVPHMWLRVNDSMMPGDESLVCHFIQWIPSILGTRIGGMATFLSIMSGIQGKLNRFSLVYVHGYVALKL